jgi:hypothetical protein
MSTKGTDYTRFMTTLEVTRMKCIPSKILINSEYLDLMISQTGMPSKNRPEVAMGIPIKIDDTIETYQFMYEKRDEGNE